MKKFYGILTAIIFLSLSANAQIVYTDVKPDSTIVIPGQNNTDKFYNLDLNNDGISDFKFKIEANIATCRCSGIYGNSGYVEVRALRESDSIVVQNSTTLALALDSLAAIDSSNHWSNNINKWQILDSGKICNCANHSHTKGYWNNATDKYLGLKFRKNNTVYYGWVRLSVQLAYLGTSLTVRSYAYNSIAGKAIKAGQGQPPTCTCRRPVPPGCAALCGPFAPPSKETPEKLIAKATQVKISPNPFSNSTTISFTHSQSQKVSITIYDMNGRLIKTLADEQMQQGLQQLTWNAKDEKGNAVNAGIYFLKMQTGNYTETKKLVVVK